MRILSPVLSCSMKLFISFYCFYQFLISLTWFQNSSQSDSLFLLLADDKPVLVLTHGDLLSISDRARVRAYLGELLGIPPTEQIFDIPGSLFKLYHHPCH